MFGNDIIPFNLEINSELNLKILFTSHYTLFKNNSFIINFTDKNIIDFNNLKLFLVNIKNNNTLSIIILNKYFKLPYNFILVCTSKLNYNINQIINKLLIPYLSYEGSLNKTKNKNDIRNILYKKYKINVNPLDNYNKEIKEELVYFFSFIFDYENINDLGLIRLEKTSIIENNTYKSLYNKLLNIIDRDNNFYNKINLFYFDKLSNISTNYKKMTDNLNVKNYLSILTNQTYILFNDYNYYSPYSFDFYKDLIAPSITSIINFIDDNDMIIFQKNIYNKLKVKSDIYFDELSHYFFITPYLLDSIYIKELNNIKYISNILNIIEYQINNIWYKESNKDKFILRNIDAREYLNIYYKINSLFKSKFINNIYFNTTSLIY